MNNRKQRKIDSIIRLLNPQPTNIEVFRQVAITAELPKDQQLFTWNEQTMTRKDCSKVPAGLSIFVLRKELNESKGIFLKK